MKKFSEFGIKTISQSFTGDKIRIERILNRSIQVIDYRIEDSKYGDGKKCLYVQIELDKEKRVIFTGSKNLIDMIEQVPKTEFPFETTIIKDNDRLIFS